MGPRTNESMKLKLGMMMVALLLAPLAGALSANDAGAAADAALGSLAPLAGEPPVVGDGTRHVVGFHEMIDTSSGEYAGQRIVHEDAVLRFVAVEVSDLALFEARVALDDNVRYVEVDQISSVSYTPNDAFWRQSDYTWGQWEIWADVAWDTTRGSTTARVCVLDTGLRKAHEEFSGSGRVAQGYDFVYSDTDPNDPNGHGTHVAGIIGATINNAKGIPGMAQAYLIPIRVLDAQGNGYDSSIASGTRYCRDQGGHVASMSLGGGGSTAMRDAIVYAQNGGVLVIAATGNDGCTCTSYPAGYSGVLGVGSVGKTLAISSFSNRGSAVDLVAPGERIVSTWSSSNTAYAYSDGTSMATPFVSGVAALVKTKYSSWSASSISSRLTGSAQDLGAGGYDTTYGYGLVRADRAVA